MGLLYLFTFTLIITIIIIIIIIIIYRATSYNARSLENVTIAL